MWLNKGLFLDGIMFGTKLNIVKVSVLSRIAVILLQVLFNNIIPDHSPDVFQSPVQDDVTIGDVIVTRMLSGFKRWDAQYFLHIARYGYTYENTLAFFPFYPSLIYYFATLLDSCFNFILSFHSLLLISGVLINLMCFVLSAIALHGLSNLVLKDRRAADITVLLFCINPASIFFSACYSECLFSFLTFMGMWHLEKNNNIIASILFGFSSITRSNGTISSCFVLHAEIKSLHSKLQILHDLPFEKIRYTIQWIITLFIKLLICTIPFVIFQFYTCLLYCLPQSMNLSWPESISEYGAQRNYTLPGENPGKWCNHNIPFSYSYIQSEYWNVGFLNYYRFKQIPNFILCFPIVFIMISAAVTYYQKNKNFCLSLGFVTYKKKSREFFDNEDCFVYLVHSFALTVMCFLCIHVQVITRLLASSSPVLYWVAARTVSEEISKDHPVTGKSEFSVKLSQLISVPNNYITWHDPRTKLIFSYFLLYFLFGIIIHVNYLPWT
ncbi:GPI mannosyltransferase 2 [Centruroides vittatus]|uniref:GPI mannosyltransferase 2 n=1 Tax=Centruroides vittatus TaxID=120091 RepID=UPI00351085E1